MKKLFIVLTLVCTTFILSGYTNNTNCKKCDKEPRQIKITNEKGLYIIFIPAEQINNIRPHVTKFLTYNKDVFKETNAELVINAGYFDPKNQGTSSYIVIDEKTVLDPTTNMSLMNNKSLQPYLDTILNRTEFRVLNCHGQRKFDIAPHSQKAKLGCKIEHSIQAGPELYPSLKLSREYFVVKENDIVTRDSISALKKCARTAIGIKDNDIYIVIATIYHKVTLPQLYKIFADLKVDKAMNFDGGGSTSLNYKGTNNPNYKNWEITSDKNKNARKLKSFLVID